MPNGSWFQPAVRVSAAADQFSRRSGERRL